MSCRILATFFLLVATSISHLPAQEFGYESASLVEEGFVTGSVLSEPMADVVTSSDILVGSPGGVRLICPGGPGSGGEKTVILNGFFQADAVMFAQDGANMGTFGDINDFADFRRARLAAKGQVSDNVGYMVEFDFAFPGRPTFMDVYGEAKNVPVLGNVRIGQWRQPFSMDALTSVKELSFLERNLAFAAFLPFRQIGIGAYDNYFGEQGTWAVSGYRFPTNAFGDAIGDSGYGMSTRVTFAPYLDEVCNRVLHLGFGFSHNRPSTQSFRYRTTPEIGITAGDVNANPIVVPFFVDTQAIAANSNSLFNAELAGAWGPALVQSEVFYCLTDTIAGPTASFSGAYAQTSYALTGEHRRYVTGQGVFGRVRPGDPTGNGTGDALELAARWSYLNLNDGVIQGGQVNDLTFGVNWYWNAFTKVQFNYIHAFQRQPGVGPTSADIAALRFQLDF